jgi:hypothetical protein
MTLYGIFQFQFGSEIADLRLFVPHCHTGTENMGYQVLRQYMYFCRGLAI